jgi:hypothetical protein
MLLVRSCYNWSTVLSLDLTITTHREKVEYSRRPRSRQNITNEHIGELRL